jgi:hypothetical protein
VEIVGHEIWGIVTLRHFPLPGSMDFTKDYCHKHCASPGGQRTP